MHSPFIVRGSKVINQIKIILNIVSSPESQTFTEAALIAAYL